MATKIPKELVNEILRLSNFSKKLVSSCLESGNFIASIRDSSSKNLKEIGELIKKDIESFKNDDVIDPAIQVTSTLGRVTDIINAYHYNLAKDIAKWMVINADVFDGMDEEIESMRDNTMKILATADELVEDVSSKDE